MAKAEGKNFNYDDTSKINANFLETFPFESVNQYIKTETNEFSAVCPFSGLPDLAKVRIEYFPSGKKCIELKSLKLYFQSYRNVGEFHENVTNRILDDFIKSCSPKKVSIIGDFNVRGGVKTIVKVEHNKSKNKRKT